MDGIVDHCLDGFNLVAIVNQHPLTQQHGWMLDGQYTFFFFSLGVLVPQLANEVSITRGSKRVPGF